MRYTYNNNHEPLHTLLFYRHSIVLIQKNDTYVINIYNYLFTAGLHHVYTSDVCHGDSYNTTRRHGFTQMIKGSVQ